MIPQTILYLDDDPTLLMVVRTVLTRKWPSAKVHACLSAEEALKAMDETPPDLMLVDYYLKEATGPEFIKQIRLQPVFKGIPAVLLTGKSDEVLSQSYKDLGIIGILHKPIKPDPFIAGLEHIWSERVNQL